MNDLGKFKQIFWGKLSAEKKKRKKKIDNNYELKEWQWNVDKSFNGNCVLGKNILI